MAQKPFEFTLQFGAGVGKVDVARGVLYGVTVAEVGDATGHFAYVDPKGRVLGVGGAGDAENFPPTSRRLQLAMDDQSLASVVVAGQQSKRFKTREDHNDAIEARAGHSQSFRMEDGKVVCDVDILDAYSNRALFLEIAESTPELIGLSGDFKFTAEVKGDKAMMRVTRIDAVDIVDKGALTHAGLFSVKCAKVDTPQEPNPEHTMAAATRPDLKAFKQLCKEVAAWRASSVEDDMAIDECMASIAPVSVPTPPGAPAPVTGKPSNPDASVKDPEANFSELKTELAAMFKASLAEATTKIKADADAAVLEMRKQFSALGMKPVAGATPSAEDLAKAEKEAEELRIKAAAGTPGAKPKDFLSLKASIAKERNIKPSEAAHCIMREQPAVYGEYLTSLGVITPREHTARLAALAK